MKRATGTFEVTLAPLPASGGGQIGRMSIDKKFLGDLQGTSRGEMLMVATSMVGSAGYVAIELVTGTLVGRAGSFVLQHSGLMTRGAGKLVVSVVPDSGTDDLAGIAGSLAIEIAGSIHSYTFDYTINGGS